jgi:hypothetical protein
MHSPASPADACPLLTREPQRALMGDTAGYGEAEEASANCGNALIGESVEKWASDGGPCLPSPIAPIAAMSRPCESTACIPTGGTSKSDSESSGSVRSRAGVHSAPKRESGALIRASTASDACGERSGRRHGDALRNTKPARCEIIGQALLPGLPAARRSPIAKVAKVSEVALDCTPWVRQQNCRQVGSGHECSGRAHTSS